MEFEGNKPISKPEGFYTIVGGEHDRSHSPEEFPEKFDGFVLEAVLDVYKGILPVFYWEPEAVAYAPQATSVVKYAQERQLPIYHLNIGIKGAVILPELLLLRGAVSSPIKETIIAHKEEWLMKKIGNNPHLVTVVGSAHEKGLETQIYRPSEERLRSLRIKKPLIKAAVRDLGMVFKVARCDFEKSRGVGKWVVGEIFEVPDLKELIM